jgi:hypothetical protein
MYLALDLHAYDEEEDRHKPVVNTEVQRLGKDQLAKPNRER